MTFSHLSNTLQKALKHTLIVTIGKQINFYSVISTTTLARKCIGFKFILYM